jgi:hypothetical protein
LNSAPAVLSAAKHFYQDILGFAALMDHGWIATYGSSQKISVQVSIASEGGSGTPVPADEPWGVRRFCVRDPFGQLINILMHSYSPVPVPNLENTEIALVNGRSTGWTRSEGRI